MFLLIIIVVFFIDPLLSQEIVSSDSVHADELLLREIEVMKQYDQDLLETVYWSLGALLTIAVLLIGFGWFANFKVYERDKESIRRDLNSFIQSEFKSIQNSVESKIKSEFESVESKISELSLSVFDENIKDVNGLIGNNSRNIDSIKTDIVKFKYELLEIEAKSYQEKGSLTNAFRSQSRIIPIVLNTSYSWQVSFTLDKMQSLLVEMIEKKEVYLDADDIHAVTKILDSIEDEHEITVRGIKELLAKSRSV